MSSEIEALIHASLQLQRDVADLRFAAPVAHVYNPLEYARAPHHLYLRRFGAGPKKVLFLGMNPGPFGMMQTGVPFGEIGAVRDWMGIDAPVARPEREHPARPITGFACTRSEVSGKRLWGLFARRFGTPERFFAEHFVVNYCPLVFLQESGANLTPDKLPVSESEPLEVACDRHLKAVIEILKPRWVIGVGRFAAECATRVGSGLPCNIGQVLHPSPASPMANKDWPGKASEQLRTLGVWE
jgi:single-strand selective monofunctional uracil DNA glycosylase